MLSGAPVAYTCCSGLYSVFIDTFELVSDGAIVIGGPSGPTFAGAEATCPDGGVTGIAFTPGECTMTALLDGAFTGPDAWSGSLQLTFTGDDCACPGDGAPCTDLFTAVTASR